MNNLFPSFFPPEVIVFFSDKEMDFTLGPDQTGPTGNERQYLLTQLREGVKHIVTIRQVHGNQVLLARERYFVPPQVDGVVTDEPGVALCIRTADCVPIFFYDPVYGAVGLAHAGWRGTQKEIGVCVLCAMQEHFQTRPQDVLVGLGPAIQKCCYQVSPEFKKIFPEHARLKQDALYLDLPVENKRQLQKAGVREKNIFDTGLCTCCDERFFSYRRQKEQAGRHVSVIMLKAWKQNAELPNPESRIPKTE